MGSAFTHPASVPEGRCDNSPGFQAWVNRNSQIRSPGGTTEDDTFDCPKLQSSLRDFFGIFATTNPAMNRWATFKCPYGTGLSSVKAQGSENAVLARGILVTVQQAIAVHPAPFKTLIKTEPQYLVST